MKMPFADIRRSSRPTATISSGKWPPTSPPKPPRSFPTTAACRWFPPRSRRTWAKPDVAIEHVKSLLKGNADDREVYIALAQMYSRVKDWPQAEENINKALELSTQAGRQRLRNFRAKARSTSARRSMTWRKSHSARSSRRSQERDGAELSGLYAGRPWHPAGRSAGLHPPRGSTRSAEWRVS